MKQKRTVRYLGVDPASSGNNYNEILLKYYAVNVEGHAVKLYSNSFFLLSKLTKDQIIFLFFIFKNVDSTGRFVYGKPMREHFHAFSRKAIKKQFATRTIARWLNQITELEIIIKEKKNRGNYILSPVFFGISSDNHYNTRERELRKTLEKPITNLARRVRAEALAEKELYDILTDVSPPLP